MLKILLLLIVFNFIISTAIQMYRQVNFTIKNFIICFVPYYGIKYSLKTNDIAK